MKVIENKYKARLSKKIQQTQRFNIDIEMEEFIYAVNLAKDIERPDRKPLYGIYEKIIERDAHLRSQLRTAHYTVQQSDFRITKAGKENPELKKLLEKSWFTDFITHTLNQEFWGHSLIEFGKLVNNEFNDVKIIDRFHVVPEFQKVLIETTDDIKNGIYYGDKLFPWFLVEIGDKTDLGLLLTAAIEIIYKKNSRNDWSAFNERFGMPLLAITTNTSNEDELDALENFAVNFATNGYTIGSEETKFDIKQATGTENGHLKYRNFAEDCDKYISQLINGQTSTSDEKSFVGAAEVHERILNSYVKGRLMRIQRVINDNLIPFLTYYGYPFADVKFEYLDLLKKENPKATVSDSDTEKKKSQAKLINDVYSLYNLQDEPLTLLDNKDPLKGIFDQLILKIYNLAGKNKLPDDLLSLNEAKTMIVETASVFEKAIKKTFKSDYNADEVFVNKLTQDVWIFSGFKTHRQLKDISNNLWDKDKLKPFYRFRDDVLSIHEDYNVNWLLSEYNMAVTGSLAAAKWHDFEKAGDRYYLQYRTVGDERVRKSHRELNRITLPPSDPFWDSFYPPNAWGCRCSAIQVLKSRYQKSDAKQALKKGEEAMIIKNKSGEINKTATEKMKIFKYNPGKQSIIFPPHHPYYKVQKRYDKIKQAGLLQYVQEKAKSILIKKYDNGGEYFENALIDKKANDYKDLSIIANEFAKMGNRAEILPKLHFKDERYKYLFKGAYERKCPDLKINDKFYEFESFKKPWNKNKVSHMLKKGLIQSDKVIIDIREGKATDKFIRRSIADRIKANKKISEIWILDKSGIRLIYKITKPD